MPIPAAISSTGVEGFRGSMKSPPTVVALSPSPGTRASSERLADDTGSAVPTPIVSRGAPGALVRLNTRRIPFPSPLPARLSPALSGGRCSSRYCPAVKRTGRSGRKLNSVVVGVSGGSDEPQPDPAALPGGEGEHVAHQQRQLGELATNPRS